MLFHVICFVIAVTVQAKNIRRKGIGQEVTFLNVDKVWQRGITGKGVVVAVLDVGVSKTHEDLRKNYNETLSYDFVNNNADSKGKRVMSHGTKCAGIIAAKLHGECRNGIAYNATIADLKILNGGFAHDQLTAQALTYKRHEIHIYSNSWGPFDNGYTVNGPGPSVKMSLKMGAMRGRNGKGSIFVFSTGNGGHYQDSCAFDGYVNSIYTIAVGAISKFGTVPGYAEPCSSVMATTYGDNMNTCAVTGCVNNFGRTSAAASLASGILALLLQANNQLTWRDVQHLIVRTSNPKREINDAKNWIINGAGLMVHPLLGFGVMDASKLVVVATTKWRQVPEQKSCTITFTKAQKAFDRENEYFIIYAKRSCPEINYIEHVQVEVSLSFELRGLLEMYLESPQGTRSQLIYARVYDVLTRKKTYKNLVVTSLHFWGENPTEGNGKWKLLFHSSSYRYRNIKGTLSNFKITFYGTKHDPVSGGGLRKGMISCKYKNGIKKFWRGYGTRCCGNMGVFDENVLDCCSDQKLVHKTSLCGSNVYNECTQICCEGERYPKIEGAITSCCGRYSYDKRTQICCNGKPEEKYKRKKVWLNWSGSSTCDLLTYEAVCRFYGTEYNIKHNKKCSGDPCKTSPCKNGGVCHSAVKRSTFTCKCTDGYQGKTCEVCKDKSNSNQCEVWKTNGYCRSPYSIDYCAKTCGHCK